MKPELTWLRDLSLAPVILSFGLLGCQRDRVSPPRPIELPRPTRATPEGMVYVPAGTFRVGSEADGTLGKVSSRGFYMDVYETTNEEYKAYVDATGAHPPGPTTTGDQASPWFTPEKANHPVVNLTYDDAVSYAKWAGKRLPTGEEWERAARGVDGRTYPWGEGFDHTKCNVSGKGTAPVGHYRGDVSPTGCYDMAGNVSEWTSSQSTATGGEGNGRLRRAVRGGSWDYRFASSKVFGHRWVQPDVQSTRIGFRCCRSE